MMSWMGLFVFYLSLGLVCVSEIEISHMAKNNGNPDLVCENNFITNEKSLFKNEANFNLIMIQSETLSTSIKGPV